MPYEELDLGLELTLPTNGTRNWGTTLKQTTWTKISQHAHTGDGDGTKIVTDSLSDNAVTSDKISDNAGFSHFNTTNTPVGSTLDINLNNGVTQVIDLENGDDGVRIDVTITNAVAGAYYRFIIIQGSVASGIDWRHAQTVLFPGNVEHGVLSAAGSPPTIATISEGNDEIDIVTMYYDGSQFYANFEMDFQ